VSLFIAMSLLAADWRYVAPKAGAEMDQPPLRALEMSAEKPEGLAEAATYRGQRRYYSQLRFGSPSSVRVAVVLDESESEAYLYVDRNRDRSIDEQDRLPEKGPLWRFNIDALELEGDVATVHKREVVVRKGRQRGRLSMATVGFLEGAVEIDGKQVRCRRTDEDGNGRFGDPADRLHLDFDGDQSFDPIAERFAVTPIVAMRGRRYALSGDPWRGRLSFTVIEGEGKIALKSPALKRKAEVASVRAGLAGRDGTPAALAQKETLAAPPGDYRMDTLNLLLTEEGQAGWQFTFAYRGGKPPVWRSLRRDDSLAVDPVGELSFIIEPNKSFANVRPGDDVTVQLRLFTTDGLLINEVLRTSEHGPAGAQPMAVVLLTTTDGQHLGEAHSGFA
jgi:hypothetical protein